MRSKGISKEKEEEKHNLFTLFFINFKGGFLLHYLIPFVVLFDFSTH